MTVANALHNTRLRSRLHLNHGDLPRFSVWRRMSTVGLICNVMKNLGNLYWHRPPAYCRRVACKGLVKRFAVFTTTLSDENHSPLPCQDYGIDKSRARFSRLTRNGRRARVCGRGFDREQILLKFCPNNGEGNSSVS